VSILAGESHQIDLVLPSAAPLNTLIDPTVIAINKVLRGRGAAELPPAPYEFARAAGMSALASDVSLAGHNIVDGDVIALIPAGTAERYGPVVENVSTALAQYASEHFVRVSAQTALAVAAVIIGGALGVASLLLWRLRWAHESAPLVPILFAAATICLVATVAIGARLGAGRVVTDGAAWAALFTAGLAAATVPPGDSAGAPHAFLAAITVLAGMWLIVRFTGRYWSAGRSDRHRRLRRGRGRTGADVLGSCPGHGLPWPCWSPSWWPSPRRPRWRCGWRMSPGRRSAPSPGATSSRAPAANPKTRSRPWRMVRPPTSP
jgi:type VII secretion integral membrane protein EccD